MLNRSFRLPLAAALLSIGIISCGTEPKVEDGSKDIAMVRSMEHSELVSIGQNLVTVGGCNDCHTPKKFDATGMHFDSTRMLSGSPAGMPLPPFSASALNPGNWVQMAPDVTAFVGPWGISYAANLTPDSATGIGAWTKENFMGAMRTGQHMGLKGGRPIMPPMPWFNLAKLSDDDLYAIYSYLRSIPAISNKVKDPIVPDDAAKMAALK